MLRKVCQEVAKASRTIVSTLAKDLGVSWSTMQRALKENLGLKSYVRCRHHNIPPGAKMCRTERTKKLLNRIKHQYAGKVVIWPDEKYFTLAQYCKHQNDQVTLRKGEQHHAPDDVRYVGLDHCSAGVMFLGIVASDRKIGPPIFLPKGLKVNSEAYINILRHRVKPWIDRNYALDPRFWQQDGASAHTSGNKA